VGYKTGGFSNGEPVAGSDSAAGAKILQEHFPAANQNPQLVIMRFSDSAWNNLDKVYAAQKSLESSPAFKAISGPFNINGNNLSPQQLGRLYYTDPGNDLIKAEGQFISADGKTVQFN
jgi:hypothetical protein